MLVNSKLVLTGLPCGILPKSYFSAVNLNSGLVSVCADAVKARPKTTAHINISFFIIVVLINTNIKGLM
jgi:hypothetical protein